jgi:hypothetical protein
MTARSRSGDSGGDSGVSTQTAWLAGGHRERELRSVTSGGNGMCRGKFWAQVDLRDDLEMEGIVESGSELNSIGSDLEQGCARGVQGGGHL